MTNFDRLGRFVVRRAWWVVGAWIALLLVALPLAPRVPEQLSAGGFILDDLESARAKALLETELGVPPSALVVVFSSSTLEAGTPAFESAAAVAIADVATAPHVARVVSHLLAPRQVSADRHTAYDIVFLDLPPDRSPEALPILRERLRQPPGLDVALAGGPAFYGDVQTVSEADLQRSEIISLPLAALVLLLVFGSVVAAAVPLVVGGAAVIVALAVVFVVASVTQMSIFVLNLATLLGLGLGVDYSLLLTSRFREELALRPDDPDRVAGAVQATVATAGRAVFFSGVTVLLGLLGLVLFEFMILRSVGIAGAIVVGLAVASALTLLPAVLTIVGTRIDRLAVRRLAPRAATDGSWARLARWVMRRPVAVLVPTLALILVLGSPFLHVRFNAPDSSILPPSVPSRVAFDRLRDEFGEGEFAPIVLAIRTTGAATSPDNLAALHDYSRRLAADPRVTRVDSLVDIDPRIRLEQYSLLYGDPKFAKIPAERLLSKQYAEERRGMIGSRGSLEFRPGAFPGQVRIHPSESEMVRLPIDDALMAADTTCVDAIDKDGVMFAATPSGAWLPSVIVPEIGIPLTQRAQSFLLIKDHPNELAGGKRPRVTLSPTLVTRGGKPYLVMSTPGGDNQDQALLQLFLDVVEFGMDAQEAVEAPRFQTEHFYASFAFHEFTPGKVNVERRLAKDTIDKLAALGHQIEVRGDWSNASAPTVILIRPGVLDGGADPRRGRFIFGR